MGDIAAARHAAERQHQILERDRWIKSLLPKKGPELPANIQAREREAERARQQSREAVREREQARIAADAERLRVQLALADLRLRAEAAASEAQAALREAVAAGDLEAAIAAAVRVDGARKIPPVVNDVMRERCAGPLPGRAGRV